jgi:hypothetical protein
MNRQSTTASPAISDPAEKIIHKSCKRPTESVVPRYCKTRPILERRYLETNQGSTSIDDGSIWRWLAEQGRKVVLNDPVSLNKRGRQLFLAILGLNSQSGIGQLDLKSFE